MIVKMTQLFIMVLILDGSSEHGAHTWSKFVKGIWIYKERVVKSDFFLSTYFMCAICSELPSYIRTIAFTGTREQYTFLTIISIIASSLKAS